MRKPLEEVAASSKLSRAELEEGLSVARRRLFELREKRPRPQRDSKLVTSWNGVRPYFERIVNFTVCKFI